MGKLAAAARIDARQPRSNDNRPKPCGRELCRHPDDFQKARRRPAARRRAIPWPPRCRAPQSRRRPGDIVPAGRRGSLRRLAPRRPLARSARRRGFSVRRSSFRSPRDRPLPLAASPTPGPEAACGFLRAIRSWASSKSASSALSSSFRSTAIGWPGTTASPLATRISSTKPGAEARTMLKGAYSTTAGAATRPGRVSIAPMTTSRHGRHSHGCRHASRVHRFPGSHLAQTANRLHGRHSPGEAEKQGGKDHAQVTEHANEPECEREEEQDPPCQGSDSVNTYDPCFRLRPGRAWRFRGPARAFARSRPSIVGRKSKDSVSRAGRRG